MYFSTNATCNNSQDLQAPVLCHGVGPDDVLPLKFLHDVSELAKSLKGLFGFLDGELRVLLLLPLRALVHCHTGTSICREETSLYGAASRDTRQRPPSWSQCFDKGRVNTWLPCY